MFKANKKAKAAKFILAILTLAVLFTLYMLADRYLIEHVDGKVLDNQADNTVSESSDSITSDDWNYSSSKTNISIKKVQTGSGKDKITYFVADVQLKDSSSLRSAFAKSEYGRNIVETTSNIASGNNAVFAVNGDYYGFRSDGILIRNGTLYRNVPARTAAALYKDGTLRSFDETEITASTLLSDGVTNTLSFGPVLIKNGEVTSGFESVSIDKNFGNRSIQGS